MPKPLNVNREAIKALAVVHGPREAARLAGLPEATVLAWSARGKWGQAKPLPAQSIRNQSPSEALRSTIDHRSNKTRLHLSKAVSKAAKHLAKAAPTEILSRSRQMNDVARTSSVTFGWEAKQQPSGDLNLQFLGNALVQVNQREQS